MDENRPLDQAKKAIRAGDKEHGKQLLIQVLEEDPSNEVAWLWMSATVDTQELRKECLEKVLEINPQNEQAHRGLTKIQGAKLSSQPQVPSAGGRSGQPTLGTCVLCQGPLDGPTNYTVYTARVGDMHLGRRASVRYDNFQAHSFLVCRSCNRQRTVWTVGVWALGLMLLASLAAIVHPVALAIATDTVLSSYGNTPIYGVIAAEVLLLVTTLGPLVAVISSIAAYRRPQNALKRKAVKHRKQVNLRWHLGYRGFTESELRFVVKVMRGQGLLR